MKLRSRRFAYTLLPLAALAICSPISVRPIPHQDSQRTPPDNTKRNKDQGPTADQQKMSPEDRAITQKIRKAIMEDTNLSTYAHNIKIISRNGKVTLRGPVRTDEEKTALGARAEEVAGAGNVTNDLSVAPPKQ